MTAQLCQSVSWPQNGIRKAGPYPIGAPACRFRAKSVLFGIHLCQHHDRSWRPRLQAGQKIKVHAERGLPLPAKAQVAVPSKRCSKCGDTREATEANFGVTRLGHLRSWCRPCERAYAVGYWRKRHAPVTAVEDSPALRLPLEQGPGPPEGAPTAPSEPAAGLDTVDGRDRRDPPATVERTSPRPRPGHQALSRRGVRPPAESSGHRRTCARQLVRSRPGTSSSARRGQCPRSSRRSSCQRRHSHSRITRTTSNSSARSAAAACARSRRSPNGRRSRCPRACGVASVGVHRSVEKLHGAMWARPAGSYFVDEDEDEDEDDGSLEVAS